MSEHSMFNIGETPQTHAEKSPESETCTNWNRIKTEETRQFLIQLEAAVLCEEN